MYWIQLLTSYNSIFPFEHFLNFAICSPQKTSRIIPTDISTCLFFGSTGKPLYSGHPLLQAPPSSGQFLADTSLQRHFFWVDHNWKFLLKNFLYWTVQNDIDNTVGIHQKFFVFPFPKVKRTYSVRIEHYTTDTRLFHTMFHIWGQFFFYRFKLIF